MKIELTFTADGRFLCDGLPNDSGIAILVDATPSSRSSSCSACPRFTYCPLSHVAGILAEIDNLDALQAACKELDLEFVHGQKTYRWFGQWVNDYHGQDAAYKQGIDPSQYGKCDHVIKVPGAGYDIGVVKQPNGKYKMIYDFYGQGQKIISTLGKGCEKLVQHYGLHRAAMVARAKGLIVQRKVCKEGAHVEGIGYQPHVKLVVTGIK